MEPPAGKTNVGSVIMKEVKLSATQKAAIERIKFETHRFARHQYAWFRLKDDRVCWFDIQKRAEPEITAAIAKFVAGKKRKTILEQV